MYLNRTIFLQNHPKIISYAAVTGPKEKRGPMGMWFDQTFDDDMLGKDSFEKAEAALFQTAVRLAVNKSGNAIEDMDMLIGGDLLNQIISASFSARELELPFLGVYGACSTMAESLALASILVDGGYVQKVVAATSSHFSSAERQFRLPLEMGGQRPQSAQWTVTGSGAAVVEPRGKGPHVSAVTFGSVIDYGIKDGNNMGAAMAPAAADTLFRFFADTGQTPEDFDYIVTGDLGLIGVEILVELIKDKNIDISPKIYDCGTHIFSPEQDVHAGGSGCGCSASLLCGYFLPQLAKGEIGRIVFMATGALLSATSSLQGESIPSVAHAVCIEGVS